MTDKASPAGWVVQLTIPVQASEDVQSRWVGRPGLGPPIFRYFNVAIAVPLQAIEATREHLAGTEDKDREMSVVRGLSQPEIVALSLNVGDVKPA
jgi:hypothetical protein